MKKVIPKRKKRTLNNGKLSKAKNKYRLTQALNASAPGT